MNKLQKKILYELDVNSRSSLSNIAKKCHTSQQMVSYVIKQFIKKKKINGFITLFDYSRFDFNNYIVLFRLFYKKKEEFKNFLDYLKNTPELINLEILDGKWSIYAMFLVPNPSYFNKLMKKIKIDNKKMIRSDIIITTVVTHYFTRKNTFDRKNIEREHYIIGGDREPIDLSNNQKKICKCLLENPVEKIKDISKKTGMGFLTITNGIKNLKKKGIIKGFKPIINFDLFDIECRKIFIKYHDFSLEMEDNLVSFCKAYTNVINFIKTFGEWDLVITIETTKKKEFNEFILNLREKYEDIIADFEIINVMKIEELRFLPRNYYDEIKLQT